MSQRLGWSILLGCAALLGCKKTVISDRVVPVAVATATIEPLKKGIGDGIPDTKATIRLTKARCDKDEYRKTVFSVKVAGLVKTDWISMNCNDLAREIVIDTKKGYCNVLQLKADVSFAKQNMTSESYQRTSATQKDQGFFKADQKKAENGSIAGVNIRFEDTNDAYWNTAYLVCLNDKNAKIDLEPITGVRNQPCTNILNGYVDPVKGKIDAPVDWNDFEFSVESDQVQFAVEGFKDLGCSPN